MRQDGSVRWLAAAVVRSIFVDSDVGRFMESQRHLPHIKMIAVT